MLQTWPTSPLLLLAFLIRLFVFKRRHKPFARILLTILNPIIGGLVAALLLTFFVEMCDAISLQSQNHALAWLEESCQCIRLRLNEWNEPGKRYFSLLIVLIAASLIMPQARLVARFQLLQKALAWAILFATTLGYFTFFAQSAVGRLASESESRLHDRYITALHRYKLNQHRIEFASAMRKSLQHASFEDKAALRQMLSSMQAVPNATALVQHYAEAHTEPMPPYEDQVPSAWHAQTPQQWRDEVELTAEEEARADESDKRWSDALDGLSQFLCSVIEMVLPDKGAIANQFLSGLTEYVIGVPFERLQGKIEVVASCMCSPTAAIREYVDEIYRTAKTAQSVETVTPIQRQSPLIAQVTLVDVKLDNKSSQTLRLYVAGPTVMEEDVPPNAPASFKLQRGRYHIVGMSDGAPPAAMDLAVGAVTELSITYQKEIWIPLSGSVEVP
jgi:hypothetical protein